MGLFPFLSQKKNTPSTWTLGILVQPDEIPIGRRFRTQGQAHWMLGFLGEWWKKSSFMFRHFRTSWFDKGMFYNINVGSSHRMFFCEHQGRKKRTCQLGCCIFSEKNETIKNTSKPHTVNHQNHTVTSESLITRGNITFLNATLTAASRWMIAQPSCVQDDCSNVAPKHGLVWTSRSSASENVHLRATADGKKSCTSWYGKHPIIYSV